MPTSSLPLDIKNFLTEFVDSVAHLEVLLMLFSNPEDLWDAVRLSRELRSNESSVTKQLQQLTQKGLLQTKDGLTYKYSPISESLGNLVQSLHSLYQMKPVAIIAAIYEKPSDKLKGFADAFKFKKD